MRETFIRQSLSLRAVIALAKSSIKWLNKFTRCSDLRLGLLLLEVVSAVRGLALDDKRRSSLSLSVLLAHGDHLESTEDLLLEFSPLDNGVVELDLRQVNEHSRDLRCLLLTNQFLNMLVNSIANYVLLGLAVWRLLVLLGGEHVSNLGVVGSSVLGVDELWLRLIDGGDVAAHGGHLAHALIQHLLLRVDWHLHHVWLLVRRLRRWCAHLLRIHRMVSVLVVHHLLVVVVLHVVVVPVVRIGTLEVAPVVLVPWLLLHLEVLVLATSELVHLQALTIVLRGVHRVEGVRASLLVGSASVVELEGGLEEECQEVDEVLRAIETGNLCLILLILLSLLSLPVVELFISDRPHLLWVAVLHVESVLALEEYVSGEVFGQSTLVLLLEVDEGLLRALDHVDSADFTLASSREVDLQFFDCRSWREVLDEETEEHDRFLVLEAVHLEFSDSLTFLLCFSHVEIGEPDSLNALGPVVERLLMFIVLGGLGVLFPHHELGCLLS